MLDIIKNSGYMLPPQESPEDLTVTDIIDRIKLFMSRCSKNKTYAELDLAKEFLELLTTYPVSMCRRQSTPTIRRVMAMFYFYRIPLLKSDDDKETELFRMMHEKDHAFFSYDDLAIIFLCSKATVHTIIMAEQAEVKQLMAEDNRRAEAREIARLELIQEEKMKLLQEKHKETSEPKHMDHLPIE